MQSHTEMQSQCNVTRAVRGSKGSRGETPDCAWESRRPFGSE